jgi:hypothetical protein
MISSRPAVRAPNPRCWCWTFEREAGEGGLASPDSGAREQAQVEWLEPVTDQQ